MQKARTITSAIARGTAAAAALTLLASAIVTLATRDALANADIAKKTGQPCTKCHTTPPALNDYGKQYKASQNK